MRSVNALLAFWLFVAAAVSATDYDGGASIGPAKGWLIINGGGGLPTQTKNLFVALAGGQNANFVVIPTAEEDADIDPEKLARSFPAAFGVKHVTVLHTRDRVRANSDGFVEPLKHASGVYIEGGRQWRLADAYLGTAVEREIKALLARGGVVCGGSAGATIQGSYLVRGAPAGNGVLMSPGHETGFALLGDSAIDQHVNTRGREKDLDAVVTAHPKLLGIGLDEQTSIVVHGDLFKVVGPGQVAIHDGKDHDGADYYFLSSGQTFNLRTRTIAPPSESLSLVSSILPSASTTQTSEYPLTLRVIAAQRFRRNGLLLTSGAGVLTSPTDLAMREQINLECDVGVYSRAGTNVYPARISKPHQLKIEYRELGSEKTKEGSCKY